MPIVWLLEWTGIGLDEYEKLKAEVDWENADGLQLHVASSMRRASSWRRSGRRRTTFSPSWMTSSYRPSRSSAS